jgi:hypothetical protein
MKTLKPLAFLAFISATDTARGLRTIQVVLWRLLQQRSLWQLLRQHAKQHDTLASLFRYAPRPSESRYQREHPVRLAQGVWTMRLLLLGTFPGFLERPMRAREGVSWLGLQQRISGSAGHPQTLADFGGRVMT